MTIEEAGEIVLGGRVYETCTSCEGKCYVPVAAPSYGKRHYGIVNRIGFQKTVSSRDEACKSCSGAGVQTSATYIQACEILGATPSKSSPPHRPARMNEADEWMFDDLAQEWVNVGQS